MCRHSTVLLLALAQHSHGFAVVQPARLTPLIRPPIKSWRAATAAPAPRLQPIMAEAAAAAEPPKEDSSSVDPKVIINLSKGIVGAGVLALSGGVAAFSSARVGVVPAIGLMSLLCAMSGYSFSLIARVGEEVGAETYRETWSKTVGDKTAIVPALTVLFKTYVGGLSYAIILGEAFASIATLAGLPPALCRPNSWICLLSAFVLLPLSLLRDLSSLAVGSVIGTIGTLCALPPLPPAHGRPSSSHGPSRPLTASPERPGALSARTPHT